MKKQVLEVYLRELETQSRMGFLAANDLNKINALPIEKIQEFKGRDRELFISEHFRLVHSLLTHSSNVSRIIWPPALSKKQNCFCGKSKAKGLTCSTCLARDRSSKMIIALQLEDPNHVLKSRTLRDHLEHFDERIDHWVQTSERMNYVQDYIGPKGEMGGIDNSDMMRQYDPTIAEFTFREETYSLVDLIAGLKDIHDRAASALLNTKDIAASF
ncbi:MULTISPECIES: hypothetical protein [unclassified Pseudomonas]|uniref:hypothetical protein n=1 Tax=unclassified Pseudomonas TaxID=196821 RepID=UPI001B342D9E|nr:MULTISPECIES: hypothetical protein [unclassified Pseudomonas]MBP5948492.1 hypothetical protein [Pseudomonas sp. P9(2020)]MBZ9560780.1 hypothetical protein [Pseudomonas sp. P116]